MLVQKKLYRIQLHFKSWALCAGHQLVSVGRGEGGGRRGNGEGREREGRKEKRGGEKGGERRGGEREEKGGEGREDGERDDKNCI